MPDVHVEKGTTARLDRVDGDLHVGRGARIAAASGSLVAVSGGASFEGDATVECSLECDSLTVERWGELKVLGDLTAISFIDVSNSLDARGLVKAKSIDVGGKLAAKAVSCAGTVRAGGVVKVEGQLEAQLVDVGGKVSLGLANVRDLEVGGKAEVGGGKIAGRARVGGVFESTGPLEFGELQVTGKCTLAEGCRGTRMAASGKLSIRGKVSCEEVDVGGVADIRGDCEAKTVTVNGKLDVAGSLSASETLDSFGSGEVRGDFRGGNLHVAGRFKASSAVLESEARVDGEIETRKGLRAKSVLVGRGSMCRGPLVGERVELSRSKAVVADWGARFAGQSVSMRLVGRMTRAEDVYGSEVVLGPHTSCRNVYARTVELGPGSIVEQVTYTDELRRGSHKVHLVRPSEKVERLPPFPL